MLTHSLWGTIESPPRPISSEFQDLASRALESESPVHYAAIYNIGEYSLAARVHLIRSARVSIDIQTFIWADGDVTRYLFSELEAAAQRGVKVRLLVDHLAPFGKEVEPLAAMATAHENIAIRYFSPISKKAINGLGNFAMVALTKFPKLNRRMHNKLFVVDGRISMLGGRNYQNAYYDWDPKFSYRDRDIVVCGPASKDALDSFDVYWEHKRSAQIFDFVDIQQAIADRDSGVVDFENVLDFDRKQFSKVDTLAGQYALSAHISDGKWFQVGDVKYAFDPPIKSPKYQFDKDSTHWGPLGQELRKAENYVVVQTPYLVASKRTKRLVREKLKENPNFKIYFSTNSLASTNRLSVAAVSLKQQKHQVSRLKYKIYQFKPSPEDLAEIAPRQAEKNAGADNAEFNTQPPRYSLHAKSIVIDGEVAIVSSSNFDPRSAYLNTESAFIIKDRALAQALESEIRRDIEPQNSWVVAKRKRIPIIGHLNNLLATLSNALPVLDIWPIHSTSCFELKDSDSPLSPDDPKFYSSYKDVGIFPEKKNSPEAIQARLLKVLFGWTAPLM